MSSHFKITPFVALGLALSGCASEHAESDPLNDPTSRQSLQKAKPLAVCCRYVQVQSTSTYGPTKEDRTPRCSAGSCANLHLEGDAFAMSDGYGSVLSSSTSYEDYEDFMGTCSEPKPISCASMTPTNACEACVIKNGCQPLALCGSDPNCGALGDCFEYCADDEECAARCLDNADPSARTNYTQLLSAIHYCEACQ